MYVQLISAALLLTTALSQSDSPSYESDDAFQSAILNSTNFYRTAHSVAPLTWNDTLASYAQDYAQACHFAHSGGQYGENLASGYPNATASVEAWGNEGKQYDYGAAQFSSSTGHFTQLVWKGTTSTGCGRVNCNGENNTPGWYVVCEYYPPGNYVGNFSANVLPAVSGASGGSGSLVPVSSSLKLGVPILWLLIAGGAYVG